MLLSIDRVLQLLAEGKSISKIAELADCSVDDVVHVIERARGLLQKYEKPLARKKIIIKRGQEEIPENNDTDGTEGDIRDMLSGAEISVVPVDSSLVFYTGGASQGDPGHAGIGLVIHDQESRQIGKISDYIGNRTSKYAEYAAVIRALKIGLYFRTRHIKIRTDSELIVRQLDGKSQVTINYLKKLHNEALELTGKFKSCKVEHVTRNLNEKAAYLAKMGSEQH